MADKEMEKGDAANMQPEELTPDETAVETWQDELPPEDDFHDQDEIPDEILEEALPDEQAPVEAAVPHRGRGVLIGALAVGALIIGGLGYLQFGVDDDADKLKLLPVSSVMDVKEIKNAAKGQKDSIEKPVPATDPSGKVDMTALFYQAQRQAAGAGATALPSKAGEAAPTESPSMAETTSEMVSTTAKEAVLPLPPPPLIPDPNKKDGVAKIENIPVKKEDIKALAPATQATAKIEEAQKAEAAAKEEAKALAAQLEEAKKALDAATKKATELEARVQALQTAPASASEAALQNKIAELEARLEHQSSNAKTDQFLSPKDKKEMAAQINSSIPLLDETQASGSEESAPAKPVASKPAKQAVKQRAPAKRKATPKPAAQTWVLRAATPDAAWVSPGPQAQELRRLSVGDTFPSLGKIKEIRQNGDKWQVVGEKGTLP